MKRAPKNIRAIPWSVVQWNRFLEDDMFFKAILIALSIAYVPVLVNAGSAGKGAGQKVERIPGGNQFVATVLEEEITGRESLHTHLAEFVAKVLDEGIKNDFAKSLALALGVNPKVSSMAFEKAEEFWVDGNYRTFDVVFEPGASKKKDKPAYLVILVQKRHPKSRSMEDVWLRLGTDGRLQRAFRSMRKLKWNGKVVKGSGVDIDMDPDEAKWFLQRELDFWLKGKGLKKKAAKKKGK